MNVSFGRETLSVWCADEPGEKGLKSWVKPMEIELYDEDPMSDDLIGRVEIDLLEYAAVAMGAISSGGEGEHNEEDGEENDTDGSDKGKQAQKPVMRSYPLSHNNLPSGKLIAVVQFLPACSLTITARSGKNLTNPNMFGSADPYLQLVSKSSNIAGGFADVDVRSETVNGGGKNPQWNGEKIFMSLADHSDLTVKCWDDDVGADDMIGR